jgi:hypothetical protein
MHIYADSEGRLLLVAFSEADEAEVTAPPPGTAQTLALDAQTNPQIVAALSGELPGLVWADVRLSGGMLYHKEQPVPVNSPGAAWSERRAALELARGLKQFNALASPTQAQAVAAIKANNRLTLIMARLLLREVVGE